MPRGVYTKSKEHCEKISKRNRIANPMKNPEVAKQLSNLLIERGCYKGERNPMFGKKRPDISKSWKGTKRPYISERLKINNPMLTPEAKAKRLKNYLLFGSGKAQSERMKNGGAAYARSFNRHPSWPQIKLYNRVKILYPSVEMEHTFRRKNGRIYYIDIVIPEFKIAIEYDGYLHKGQEEYDRKRQLEIEKEGWKFLRYNQLPNDNDLFKAIKESC